MKYFKIDFNKLLKIRLLGKETLSVNHKHSSRISQDYIIYVITNGSLKLKINGTPVTLQAGDIYLFNKGEFHEPDGASFCEYYYIHFQTDDIEAIDLSDEAYTDIINKKRCEILKLNVFKTDCYNYMNVCLKQHYHISVKSQFEHIKEILKNNILTPECRHPEKRLAVTAAFQNLLFELENSQQTNREKEYYIARKIASYIEENYTDAISSRDIESNFYLNFDYANRLFKKVMNCNIIKYRNFIRINYAKAKMYGTNMSINEIAADSGFESVQYFSRAFKKAEGISPSKYREMFCSKERTGGLK